MSHAPHLESPIEFAGGRLDRSCHVCAFFNSADEEDAVMLPFVRDGLDRGEKAFHIIDPEQREAYLDRQRVARSDVAELQQRGQFELRGWDDAYLRGGRFDQNAMLALITEVLERGRAEGFPLTRLVAHMEWSLEDRPGVNDLVEYETRLNHVLPKYSDPVICVYDTSKYSGGVILDILRTHPMVIVGGVLQENPFFVPPDQFLMELRERDGRSDVRREGAA